MITSPLQAEPELSQSGGFRDTRGHGAPTHTGFPELQHSKLANSAKTATAEGRFCDLRTLIIIDSRQLIS